MVSLLGAFALGLAFGVFCHTLFSLACPRAAAKKRFAEADVIDAAGRMQDGDDDRETKRARME